MKRVFYWESCGEEKMSDFKGYIGKYYTVWCGRCTRWDDVPAKSNPDKIARKMGWKSSTAFGWICPNCINGRTSEWDLRGEDNKWNQINCNNESQ